MNTRARVTMAVGIFVLCGWRPAIAQVELGSEFTYQGQLRSGGTPVNDTADVEFTLWDADTAGNMIGSVLAADNVNVVEGVFTVNLDFGVMAFNGDARWLEIAVRSPAGVGGFTTLSPRQPINGAPYALQTRGLYVDDQLRVGIGNASPQHPLSIGEPTSDAGAVEARVYSTDSGQWNGSVAAGGTGNSVILGELLGVATIGGHDGTLSAWSDLALNTFGGNVSIGDTPATDRLTVAGTIKSTTGGFVFPDGSIQATAAMTTPSPWQSIVNGIAYPAGNVGIGTTAPRFELHNAGDYYGKGHVFLYAYEGDGMDGTAYVQARDDSGTSSIGLQLRTQSAGTLVDVINMTPAGNVGIGLPGATDRLTVAGTIKSTTGGFVFPDGTTQSTAAMTSESSWQTTSSGIAYEGGNVSIGTSEPSSRQFRVVGTQVGAPELQLNVPVSTNTVFFSNVEQEFVPSVDGYLTSVTFKTASQVQGVPSQVGLELFGGTHNQPGASLGQTPVTNGTDIGYRTKTFDPPIYLQSGNVYRLVFTTLGQTILFANQGDVYPSGGTWSNGNPVSGDIEFYIYMAPTGDTPVDRLVVDELGRVGIGTSQPQFKLDVAGDLRASAIAVSTSLSAGSTISAGTMITTPTLQITGGSDIAEPYDVVATRGESPMPGFVVSIDPDHVGKLRVTANAYDATVAGIISGAGGVKPGLTLTQRDSVAQGAHPVAMNGRVWCYVDADAGGAVKAGDLLTTSNTPGHAMKAIDPARSQGAIIGKAMSSLESGRGLVLVLVSLQ